MIQTPEIGQPEFRPVVRFPVLLIDSSGIGAGLSSVNVDTFGGSMQVHTPIINKHLPHLRGPDQREQPEIIFGDFDGANSPPK